jgi:hypothetical protein
MRLPHTLKSTHWVMWSSPVLLLVLVFTWTASSSSTPAHHLEAQSLIPTHSTETPRTPSTTIAVTTTTSPDRRAKVRVHATASLPTISVKATIATIPPTSAERVKSSSGATDSNVRSNVNASVASASSGVVSGQLSPALRVADVPLRGPGTWMVAMSAPASVTLTCEGTAITVNGQFVIAAHTTCQVTITAAASNHFVTWELTPTN